MQQPEGSEVEAEFLRSALKDESQCQFFSVFSELRAGFQLSG